MALISRPPDKDIAVHGKAETDPDFTGGGDTVRYSVAVGDGEAPFQVEAELWYQPIAYRWAMNLKPYDAPEPKRFVGYYQEMSSASAVLLVRTAATTKPMQAVATAETSSPARSGTQ